MSLEMSKRGVDQTRTKHWLKKAGAGMEVGAIWIITPKINPSAGRRGQLIPPCFCLKLAQDRYEIAFEVKELYARAILHDVEVTQYDSRKGQHVYA